MTEKHSPLGASGAERWIHCSGSVALIKSLQLPQSDEPDYRREGTAAHAAAAHCILNRQDAWEIIGQEFGDHVVVNEDIAKAIQLYLDVTRDIREKADTGQGELLVEEHAARPDVDPDAYGTLDLSYYDKPILDVTDYKHGAGIAVDVEWNAQLMYYAWLKLSDYPDCKNIRLRIVQPRAFHQDGPVREWMITPAQLNEWVNETLLPAMVRARVEREFSAGEHCRFCPAKLLCPVLTAVYRAAMIADPKVVVELSNISLALEFQAIQAVDFYKKAVKDELFRRLMAGQECEGTKLVAKKANRVWKSDAPMILKARFGDAAFSQPELLTPAQIEKISADAANFAKEYAYTPQTGLTVALASDKKPGVKVEKVSEALGPAGLAYLNEEAQEIPIA